LYRIGLEPGPSLWSSFRSSFFQTTSAVFASRHALPYVPNDTYTRPSSIAGVGEA
jgi:hypothetical protein